MTVVAIVTGVGIAALATRLLTNPLVVDWAGVGALAGAAVAVVLVVTASAFPAVRSAARLESLRTE
ncbi:hypothetical protein SD37_35660 [Amycolatopsis orientalis]|uniref:ABC3 transporter permease protein domain-containing protein n=1 Tax=Amycolatopsis orientalis TaxID=31958 RepID=A0A193C7Q4_AMYOR|nr:hypothetical protein [Amycolatopsis orientalis]ANN20398.1 hypothetical protein SD37_35660 [Amycolatopsis orientalis]